MGLGCKREGGIPVSVSIWQGSKPWAVRLEVSCQFKLLPAFELHSPHIRTKKPIFFLFKYFSAKTLNFSCFSIPFLCFSSQERKNFQNWKVLKVVSFWSQQYSSPLVHNRIIFMLLFMPFYSWQHPLFPFLVLSPPETIKKMKTDFCQFFAQWSSPQPLYTNSVLVFSAFMFIHAFLPLEIQYC